VSLIRKWPPISRLDLRDSTDCAIPFLTGEQNAILDAAALVGLARREARDHELDPDVLDAVALIPSGKRKECEEALAFVISTTTRNAGHRALQENDVFRHLAQALRFNTLLWMRIDGCPEDREIVKFSYDVPVDDAEVRPWSKPSFGLEHFVFEFEAPHCGATGSYHCNVVAPAPLQVLRADIAMYEMPTDGTSPPKVSTSVRHSALSTQARPQSSKLDLYVGVAESQAKFYVAGDRNGLAGRLFVAVVIQSQALLASAAATSLVAAAILALFAADRSAAISTPEPAVAVLVLTPIVFGSILVRPVEHVLAGGFLVGIRRLMVAAAAMPVIGGALIAVGHHRTHWWLHVGLGVVAGIEAVVAGALARALRAGRRMRLEMKPHDDGVLR
jgi:hypothetical protein